jgi:hypothetical protein
MWRIVWAPNIASRWQMGFNLAFKRLIYILMCFTKFCVHPNVLNVYGQMWREVNDTMFVDKLKFYQYPYT